MAENRRVFKGRTVDLWLENAALPNGNTVQLEIIHHPGAAAIVAVDDAGRVALVRQYRHAAGGWILELPAGKLDAGEPPLACAARELREETGLVADDLHELGWIFTTPGFTDEKIFLFLARHLHQGDADLQHDEVLTVEHVPFADALAMIHRGEIRDAKSIAGLFLASRELVR